MTISNCQWASGGLQLHSTFSKSLFLLQGLLSYKVYVDDQASLAKSRLLGEPGGSDIMEKTKTTTKDKITKYPAGTRLEAETEKTYKANMYPRYSELILPIPDKGSRTLADTEHQGIFTGHFC
jgi:hypothetical protein